MTFAWYTGTRSRVGDSRYGLYVRYVPFMATWRVCFGLRGRPVRVRSGASCSRRMGVGAVGEFQVWLKLWEATLCPHDTDGGLVPRQVSYVDVDFVVVGAVACSVFVHSSRTACQRDIDECGRCRFLVGFAFLPTILTTYHTPQTINYSYATFRSDSFDCFNSQCHLRWSISHTPQSFSTLIKTPQDTALR